MFGASSSARDMRDDDGDNDTPISRNDASRMHVSHGKAKQVSAI